jgi:ubiquinone/menaquinone biosynthesis C-methylase UbiE
MAQQRENWSSGDKYERYMGRWSRRVADAFIQQLNLPVHLNWLDVGSGTGALSQAIVTRAQPMRVLGLDLSAGFASDARNNIANARFLVSDAQNLPLQAATFDAVVSGLVLNFVPQPQQAVHEMRRVAKSNAVVSVYVWDYAGKMEFLRYFWDAAAIVDGSAKAFDQAERFSICQPDALTQVFKDAGLNNVEVHPLEIATVFQDFDDYWQPFTLGNFPAPKYTMSLSEEKRAELRQLLLERLPIDTDGKIHLSARVWVARGTA